MCVGPLAPPSSPSPPPPPAPLPPPPTAADPEVRRAKGKARTRAALASGRQSTLLGGQLFDDPTNQPLKTLLGA